MNICFFNLAEAESENVANGVVRVATVLAGALRKRGHSVVFYPPPNPSSVQEGGTCRSWATNGKLFRKFLIERNIDAAVWQMGNCRIPFSLKNLPCRLIAVWHNAPDYKMSTYAELLAEKYNVRIPIIRSLICSSVGRCVVQWVYECYRALAFFYTTACSDKFVLLSEKFFPNFLPAKFFPKKVCAIPNPASFGVEGAVLGAKQKELLFVGRLENGQKRVDLLLKIWEKLEGYFPDWCLRIVGDGPSAEMLRRLALKCGLKRVFFEGRRDPIPFYRDAAIFCMTSAFEGWGMTLVEASAFGCVPVAFDSYASVSDIISHGNNGILVPAFDCEKYATELSALMCDSDLRNRMGVAALDRIRDFAPEKIADRWETLFSEMNVSGLSVPV